MDRISRRILCLLIALSLPAIAGAMPAKGLGIFVGSASHSNDVDFSGVGQTYDSGGGGFGFDYQMPLGENSSLNLFYLLFASSNPVTNETPLDTGDIGEDILGVQYRFWPAESVYVGAHAGLYSQSIMFNFFNPEDGSGFGVGLTAGGEFELNNKVKLTASAQYDTASIGVLTGAGNSSMSGITLLLGVRIVQ